MYPKYPIEKIFSELDSEPLGYTTVLRMYHIVPCQMSVSSFRVSCRWFYAYVICAVVSVTVISCVPY